MKAKIKFQDGREAVINLTEEQIKEVHNQQTLVRYDYFIGVDERGFNMFQGLHMDNPHHTFKKREHAQLLADRFNLEMEMFRWASEMNEGWVPVWGDNAPYKYGIVWISVYHDIQIEKKQERNEFVFGLSFKNIEIAQQALELFGDRILSLFGKQF